MPQGADDLPWNANGPAYTSRQDRHGVPLSYVSEKLSRAIGDLHRLAQRCQSGRDDLRSAMYHLLVAYLGLRNMLGKANDHTLTHRLLDGSSQNSKRGCVWLTAKAMFRDLRVWKIATERSSSAGAELGIDRLRATNFRMRSTRPVGQYHDPVARTLQPIGGEPWSQSITMSFLWPSTS
ncbi:hypothetical protein HDG37_007840 [Paraburkholderia sp. MM5384-R2]|nr:hypothetical protein [Paraburkholderia sp. MM5384-R2]